MIQSVLGRFSNPPSYPADAYAAKNQWQGPLQKFACPVSMSWCDEDCDDCLEFVTTCDACHCAGHEQSPGWTAVDMDNGQPRVLCMDCYENEQPK
jgi:hypothetical protein